MKRLLLLITAVVAAVSTMSAGYTMLQGRLDNSAIYPGTVHTFRIMVPDVYVPTDPAALYVGLDGVLCNAPEVIDSLIRAELMPVTIGVFLDPGYIVDDSGEVIRYNRSNEFDATDDRFARFIEQELLPAVESMSTSDRRQIRLSHEPAMSMIFGLSSGGIAAFNAAWHRPDLFSKVYSGCGTFVPMRGGNDLESIVRKHEPLPLRVYLQDGYSDTWNPIFGSWYEHNRMLASALEFSGYDCAFDWAEGGHSVKRTSEIFPQVMTWIWRDQPSPAVSRTDGNDLLKRLLAVDTGWQKCDTIVEQYGMADAIYPDSSLIAVASQGTNYIDQYILSPGGERHYGQRFYWLHSYDNAALNPGSLMFDGDGYLWVVTRAGIQICDQNGRVRGILRLPRDCDADTARINIGEGVITISAGDTTWRRRLAVRGAVAGVRPVSEGPA
ncbi:MAG: alpha/beta hydrolase-fold protein [Odoribacter sp.]|nr:alpha/beta hydrolase-fold protein [Odoribacter sp.]